MLKPLTLKNGLTVLRFPNQSAKTVCVGFLVKTGSSVEGDTFPSGISYLIERLFWCGTDKYPTAKSLITAIEGIGGRLHSLTTQELTQFYLMTPSYNQFKAISLLSSIIQHSFFEERDLEREKSYIIEEIKRNDEYDNEYNQLSLANIYQEHSLGQPVKGTIDSLTGIELEDILEYLAHQYNPKNSYLVISGNFDNRQISELIEQEWTYWNPKNRPIIRPDPLDLVRLKEQLPKKEYLQRGTQETRLSLGFIFDQGIKPSELLEKDEKDSPEIDLDKIHNKLIRDRASLLVLNGILGQGMSSRLWLKTVEEEAFFSKIESEIIAFENTGFLQISGVTDNSQFTFALESVFLVLESLRKTTVSINELAKAKEFVKGRLIIENSDLLSHTVFQSENFVFSQTGTAIELDALLEAIDKVESPNLRAIALDFFNQERLFITTYGTAKETKIVDKLVKKYLS